MKKYYRISVGEVVNQVYEVNAKDWDDAKKVAIDSMDIGDILVECPPEAVFINGNYPDYRDIEKKMCSEYAILEKGTWAQREPSGEEYWEERVLYFNDAPDDFINGNGEEFYDWEQD